MSAPQRGYKKHQERLARGYWWVVALGSWLLAYPAVALLAGGRKMMESLGPDFGAIAAFTLVGGLVVVLTYKLIPRRMERGEPGNEAAPVLSRIQPGEAAVLLVALTPTILGLIPSCRGWVPREEALPAWLSQGVLMLAAGLLQLTAIYFFELIWLHGWLKRRISAGSARGKSSAWMEDFALYAREEEAAAPAAASQALQEPA